jgi:hypothetical protein
MNNLRPTGVPAWGYSAGSSGVVFPPEVQRANGWSGGQRAVAGYQNWLHSLGADWFNFLEYERTYDWLVRDDFIGASGRPNWTLDPGFSIDDETTYGGIGVLQGVVASPTRVLANVVRNMPFGQRDFRFETLIRVNERGSSGSEVSFGIDKYVMLRASHTGTWQFGIGSSGNSAGMSFTGLASVGVTGASGYQRFRVERHTGTVRCYVNDELKLSASASFNIDEHYSVYISEAGSQVSVYVDRVDVGVHR